VGGLLSMCGSEGVVLRFEVSASCSGNSVGEVECGIAVDTCVCVTLDADENVKGGGRSSLLMIASTG
jgi:hypothetical protein